MKKRKSRSLAIFLAAAMITSMMPLSVLSVSALDSRTELPFVIADPDDQATNTSSLSSDVLFLGESVTVNLSVSNRTEVYYQVQYRLKGTSSWENLGTATQNGREVTMSFTPDQAGNYEIQVYALYDFSDSTPNGVTSVVRLPLEVAEPLEVMTESFMNFEWEPIFVDQELYVYAWAWGGFMGDETQYQYKFEYYPVKENSEWVVLSDFSEKQGVDFKFSEAGEYYFRITAKDLKGYESSSNHTLHVYNDNVNTTTISAEGILASESLVIHPSFETDIPDNNDGYVYYRYKQDHEYNWHEEYFQTLEDLELQFPYSGMYDLEVTPYPLYGTMEPKSFQVEVSYGLSCFIDRDFEICSYYNGETLHLNTTVSGGQYVNQADRQYTYAYQWHYPGENTWHSLGRPSNSPKCDFQTDCTGDIEIMVTVTDKYGNQATDCVYYIQADSELTVSATVNSKDFSLNGQDGVLNATVNVSGGCTGDNAWRYCQFFFRPKGSDELIEMDAGLLSDDVGENTEYELYPYIDAGEYDLIIRASDGTKSVDTVIEGITIYDMLYINPDVPYRAAVGSTVTVDAGIEGGKAPYNLTYDADYFGIDENGDETGEYDRIIIAENTDKTSVKYTITKPGRYIFNVWGRDDFGDESAGEAELYTYNKLVSKSSVSADLIYTNDTAVMQGGSTGGLGNIKYSFFYKSSTATKWTTAKVDEGAAYYNFQPTKAGTYDLCIKATDQNNTTVKEYFTLRVVEALNASISPSDATSKISHNGGYPGNTPLTYVTTVTGGTKPYTYTYILKNFNPVGTINEKVLAENSTSNKATFTPEGFGSHMLTVIITDADGLNYETSAEFYVDESTLKLDASLSSDSIKLGETVTARAAAEGGSGSYTYACYYKTESAKSWTTKANFGTVSKFDITPNAVGTYDICIKVKDSNGTVEKEYFKVTVDNSLNLDVELSNYSVAVGGKIKITANATGGNAPYQYTCLYTDASSDTAKWVTIAKFGTKQEFEFSPKAEVPYQICVKVKDADGTIVKKFFDVRTTAALKNTSQLSLGADGSNVSDTELNITLGDTFQVWGSSTGGTAPVKYTYYYKFSTDSKWTTAKSYDTANFTEITPTKVGTYNVCVYAKDMEGTLVKKYMTVNVASAVQELKNTSTLATYDEKTIADELTVKTGETVKIMPSSTGGNAPITYTCYYRTAGSTKWTTAKISAAALLAQVTFDKAGTYNICVYAKDSTNTLVKKYMNVIVEDNTTVEELKNTSTLANARETVKADELTIKADETFRILPSSTGGNAPITYTCYYRTAGSTKWTTAKISAAALIAEVTLDKAGSYNVCVYAKDSDGTLVKKYMNVTVTE